MRITDVLRGKGTQVVTVPPDTKVRRLLDVLAEHGIAILAILAVSVVITLLVTVATFLLASRFLARGQDKP